MNNRTEAKLTDLSGMQKAIEEILKQAWERGRKYGQNEERPQGEWVGYYGDVSKCSICGVIDFKSNFCPNCGAKMIKPQTQKLANNSQELVKDLVKDRR